MKTHNLKLFLLFLVLLFISQSQKQLVCINGGILIMVRTRLQPFSVKYQCLCPFSYYGETCGFFRGIYCFYSNQQILKYDPEINPKAKLQFQMECFLKKLINQSSISNEKQINNYLRLPLTSSQVQQQLKSNNYYIDQEYQIIWANTTEILDEKGNIIRNGTDNRTDDQILNSYPHYQFNYTDNFYGIPLISTKIIYNLNAIRFIDKDISVSKNLQPLFEQSITNQVIGNRTKISGTFQIIVNQSWKQFGVVRLQLLSSMYYGDNYDIFQRLSMNSGRWRLYDPKFTHGEIIDVNNYTIPGSFWILFVFIMLFALITCSRIAIKYYKKWRNKKMTNQLLDQQSEIQKGKQ